MAEAYSSVPDALTTTSPGEFDKLISRLTEAGITHPQLIRLNKEWKNPAAASNLKLSDGTLNPVHRLTIEQARQVLQSGVNVGIYGSPDGVELHDIDLEDGVFKIPYEKIQELITLFDTLTVRTRSGGIDFYFKNSGEPKNPHIFYDGVTDAGEVRREWQYVCVAGSFVPRDKPNPENGKVKGFTPDATGQYVIIHDAPIRPFDKTKAPDWYSFEKKKTEPAKKPNIPLSLVFDDKEVVRRATEATNGEKLKNLLMGITTGYSSDSEADLACAIRLAFWTRNPNQIERIMRGSGLYREKWDTHKNYLSDITIAKALIKQTDHYDPNYKPATTNGSISDEPERETITAAQIQEVRDNHIKSFGELPELPEGFFRDYMDYGKRMSYAYPAFHFAGALTLVSMMCGRRVAMKSTASEIYLNIMAMCIGPTSISGKSTANDMVTKKFDLVRQEGSVDELPKKMSPQGLLQRLSKIPCRYWGYDECSEFFSDSQSHWGEALESNLCSIYDGRASGYGLSLKKKEDSEWNVKDAFVSCLWNTTNTGIEEKIQMRSVSSGLVPRFMWFWCHGKNDIRMNRDTTTEDILADQNLQRKLWALRDILMKRPLNAPSVFFRVSPILEKWQYEDTLAHMGKEDELHRVGTARLVPQAYKMAMMFSLMDETLQAHISDSKPEEPLSLTIPDKYAELAKEIAEHYFRPRLEYVINLARYNDSKNFQDQIRKSIEKHGTVATKSQIIRDTRISKRNLEEALTTMVEGEILEEYNMDGSTVKGRQSIAYRLIPQTS